MEKLQPKNRADVVKQRTEEIAYHKYYLPRGKEIHGHDVEDWLQAEKDALAEEDTLTNMLMHDAPRRELTSLVKNSLESTTLEDLIRMRKSKGGKYNRELSENELQYELQDLAARHEQPQEEESVEASDDTTGTPLTDAYHSPRAQERIREAMGETAGLEEKTTSETKRVNRAWINIDDRKALEESLKPENKKSLIDRLTQDPNVREATERLGKVNQPKEEKAEEKKPAEENKNQPEALTLEQKYEALLVEFDKVKKELQELKDKYEGKPAAQPTAPKDNGQEKPEENNKENKNGNGSEKPEPAAPKPKTAEEIEAEKIEEEKKQREKELEDAREEGRKIGFSQGEMQGRKEGTEELWDSLDREKTLWERIKMPFKSLKKAKTAVERYEIEDARKMAGIFVLGGAAFATVAWGTLAHFGILPPGVQWLWGNRDIHIWPNHTNIIHK